MLGRAWVCGTKARHQRAAQPDMGNGCGSGPCPGQRAAALWALGELTDCALYPDLGGWVPDSPQGS